MQRKAALRRQAGGKNQYLREEEKSLEEKREKKAKYK